MNQVQYEAISNTQAFDSPRSDRFHRGRRPAPAPFPAFTKADVIETQADGAKIIGHLTTPEEEREEVPGYPEGCFYKAPPGVPECIMDAKGCFDVAWLRYRDKKYGGHNGFDSVVSQCIFNHSVFEPKSGKVKARIPEMKINFRNVALYEYNEDLRLLMITFKPEPIEDANRIHQESESFFIKFTHVFILRPFMAIFSTFRFDLPKKSRGSKYMNDALNEQKIMNTPKPSDILSSAQSEQSLSKIPFHVFSFFSSLVLVSGSLLVI